MGNSKQIKEPKQRSSSRNIKENDFQKEYPVCFSLKHFDISNPKFSIHEREGKYFIKVFERLKHISSLKILEVLSNRSSSLRSHPINWGDTTEPNGFNHLDQQLQEVPPYQFEISANAHGRVHGFFIDNVFYIVWFDPDHKLYK